MAISLCDDIDILGEQIIELAEKMDELLIHERLRGNKLLLTPEIIVLNKTINDLIDLQHSKIQESLGQEEYEKFYK